MNNLLDFIDENSVVTEILMMRTTYAGSFLLIEGVDDSKFWKKHISNEKCSIIICGGKKHVTTAITKLSENNKIAGVLGIVDDDFDSLEGKTLNLPNLITTETHDLECLLLRSRAFDKVLIEYANDKEIKKLEETEGRKIREALLDRGVVFGRLRWLSVRNKWGLYKDHHDELQKKFEPIKREHVVDKEWTVNETKLLEAVIQELTKLGHLLTAEELPNLIVSLPQDADPWKVCNGHELVYLLEIALSGKLATSEPKKGGIRRGDEIPKMLRQSIESTEFLATELATKVKIWECDNQPYQIFRADN